MNATLLKATVALAPVGVPLCGSTILFARGKTAGALLQLPGSAFLATVVLTHLAEAMGLFPWMGWGRERSPGHYLDLLSAVLALTLFPVGYLLHTLNQQGRPDRRGLPPEMPPESRISERRLR